MELKWLSDERRMGQWYGLLIALVMVFCGSYVALNGNGIAGAVIATSFVVGLVFVLYSSRKDSSSDKSAAK